MPAREPTPFDLAVYAAVRTVPTGRVTSYGHIAKLIGKPRHARHVGTALKLLPRELADTVPWWRIVNFRGIVSEREGGGVAEQIRRLRAEGIAVDDDPDDVFVADVDLDEYGWFAV